MVSTTKALQTLHPLALPRGCSGQFLLKNAVLGPITKEPLPAESPTSYFLLQSGFPRVCLHMPFLMHLEIVALMLSLGSTTLLLSSPAHLAT